MNALCTSKKVQGRECKRANTRGVALIFTLLILALLMVLSLGMVIALSSQTFIGGYYRNFRGAFYSADSGLNISRQAMVNKILSLVPASVSVGSQPLPAGSDTTIQTYVNSTYSGWTSIGGGQATNSWPGQFEISGGNTATFAYANCHLSTTQIGVPPAGGPYTCSVLPPASSTCSTTAGILTNCFEILSFQYTYNYSLDILGEVKGNEQSELAENGTVQITVNTSPPSGVTTNSSFAAWGMFIDQDPIC
jgi:Tfp pilus assembly protein PilX